MAAPPLDAAGQAWVKREAETLGKLLRSGNDESSWAKAEQQVGSECDAGQSSRGRVLTAPPRQVLATRAKEPEAAKCVAVATTCAMR
jgi:hypothetical protein